MNTQLFTKAFLYTMTAYVLSMAFPDVVMAATGGQFTDLRGAADQTVTQVGTVPQIVNSLAFVIGIGLVTLGIIDLKKHADNPANNPMKNGISKLLVGGALVALPAGVAAIKQTVGLQGSGVAPNVGEMNF